MKDETRIIRYDEDLHIEAYRINGFMKCFPNHFHEHYVVGLIEGGRRQLSCKGREYSLAPGEIVIFNPGDNHACAPLGNEALDYRGVNIGKEAMLDWAGEVTGKRELPGFSKNVINDREIACCLRPLHDMIIDGSGEFEKEEYLLLMLSQLIRKYGQPFERCIPACREEIERACGFIQEHYAERICLEEICSAAGLSKSTLLRAFTKSKGVTPYRYLEAVRISEAKKLLEQGMTPGEAALLTGFSDQSHFTNFFSMFIGLAPGVYREIFQEKNMGGKENSNDR